ncbi:Hsp20/alpha crystallin family protein [Sulfuriroseicoccus oceanibius]|uniref:Hsp20/alpha crystallin family protein n=1 Tax=Sulfuriroseicoccus oceanibius TaxID=2707525 RepID=A0A6B3LBP2_9BACT|nr:Hsp20/alpha crystallin family protein [Sulfuriroseicoccus oceanibius]QQL45340.1 Hsp20/alpha crystallin family protein [Sulfuriroseicoccus oceanibius]
MSTCTLTKPEQETAAALPTVRPPYNTKRLDDALEVGIALPGVAKEDVSVNFDKGVLSVEASRRFEAPGDQMFVHREIDDTRYVLNLRVSDQLDTDRVSAALENGILALRIPLREETKPRKIEIS